MSSQQNNHAQAPAGTQSAAPNRAARRAQKSGKAASAQAVSSRKNDQLRASQVVGQPRTKGRRGNR